MRFRSRDRAVGRGRVATGLLLLGVTAALAAGCGGTEPPGSTTAPGTESVAAADAFESALRQENGSGQTGTAELTTSSEGVKAIVRLTDDGVAQYALLAGGTCDTLEQPIAAIDAAGATSVTGGGTDGHFEADPLIRYADGQAISLDDLRGGSFAVVIVDASYRKGVTEEIPPDVRVFQGPDPAAPFGEVPYVLAACGDLPVD